MEFFKNNIIYNFMGKSKASLFISIILVLSSYLLLVTKGLNYGIDFAGGTVVQVKYEKTAPLKDIRKKLSFNHLFDGSSISNFGTLNEIIIKMKKSSSNVKKDIGDIVETTLKGTGKYKIRRVDIVGPKIGAELKKKGLMALLLSILGILIYVSFRFEWRFAVASVIALIHDVSIAMGAVSLFSIDVNLDVLAAILTILGYSLNDTIIVFDRIREKILSSKDNNLNKVINEAVSNTLSRTLITSLTTFFVILTLFLFGGAIIHPFSFTLLVGIIVGTYSSIFIASPSLLFLKFNVRNYKNKINEKKKQKKEKDKLRLQYDRRF